MFIYRYMVDGEHLTKSFQKRDAAIGQAQADLITGRALPEGIDKDGTPHATLDDIKVGIADVGGRFKRAERHVSHPTPESLSVKAKKKAKAAKTKGSQATGEVEPFDPAR